VPKLAQNAKWPRLAPAPHNKHAFFPIFSVPSSTLLSLQWLNPKKNWKRKGLLRKSDFFNKPGLWLKASGARRLRG